MKARRIVAALVLLPLLVCGLAAPRAAAMRLIPPGRWTFYAVQSVPQSAWGAWYSIGPWPIRYRFQCSKGALVIDASNTSNDQQNVPVVAWDGETDRSALDNAIDNGWAERNAGFVLQAGQSITLSLYRPALCAAASSGMAFAAVYGR